MLRQHPHASVGVQECGRGVLWSLFEGGGHGGMDFIMDYRLIYCLVNGLPLDQDVYDAAEWSSIIELSKKSVLNQSMPVKIPDFTRGAWQKVDKVTYFEK